MIINIFDGQSVDIKFIGLDVMTFHHPPNVVLFSLVSVAGGHVNQSAAVFIYYYFPLQYLICV